MKSNFDIGNKCIEVALENTYTIMNMNGEVLTHIGGDRMAFSPIIECNKNRSTILFDSVEKAENVIDSILAPQEDCGYYVQTMC